MDKKLPQNLWLDWTTVDVLGSGSYGSVYLIQRQLNSIAERAALKVISIPKDESEIRELYSEGFNTQSIVRRYDDYRKNFLREYEAMRILHGCDNVVHCDDYRTEKHPNGIGWNIYIKMELLKPLLGSIGPTEPVSEQTVIRVGIDICTALCECAKFKIIHRDIKPQNILVSPNGVYKLGDFGVAKAIDSSTVGTRVGTSRYMAPEVFYGKAYDERADQYSLGMVLYWLANNRRSPFEPQPPDLPTPADTEAALNWARMGQPLPDPANAGAELSQVIRRACAPNPAERFRSAEEMRDALVSLLNPPKPEPDDPFSRTSPAIPGSGVGRGSGNGVEPASVDPGEHTVSATPGSGVDRGSGNGVEHTPVDPVQPSRSRMPLILGGAAVAVLAVAAALFFLLWGGGEDIGYDVDVPAAMVDNEPVSVPLMNYYYMQAISDFCTAHNSSSAQLQPFFDPALPLDQQPYPDSNSFASWDEYFIDCAKQDMQFEFDLYRRARQNGIQLSDEAAGQIDSAVQQMASRAQNSGHETLDAYLADFYGPGCNEDTYREYLTIGLLGDAYSASSAISVSITSSDIAAEYAANPRKYDMVSFHYLVTNDFDQAALSADAFDRNSTMSSGYKSWDTVCQEFSQEAADWLFSSSRTPDDTILLLSSDGKQCYVLCFDERDDLDYPAPYVQCLFFPAGAANSQADSADAWDRLRRAGDQSTMQALLEEYGRYACFVPREGYGTIDDTEHWITAARRTFPAEISTWLFSDRVSGDFQKFDLFDGCYILRFQKYEENARSAFVGEALVYELVMDALESDISDTTGPAAFVFDDSAMANMRTGITVGDFFILSQ